MNSVKSLEKNSASILCNSYIHDEVLVFNCHLPFMKFFDFYTKNKHFKNKVMERSKRECINQKKVKEISQQLLKGRIFIPTTYVALEGPITFYDHNHNQIGIKQLQKKLNERINLIGQIGITKQNSMATLNNFDLIEALKYVREMNREVLEKYKVNINFIYSISSDIEGIETLFVEINQYNSVLPNHIQSYFNKNNLYGNMARKILDEIPNLKTIVEINKINISKYQNKIYTYNNILTVIELFGSSLSNVIVDDDYRLKLLKQRTELFLTELLKNNYIAQCIDEPKNIPFIKEKNILTSAVGLSVVSKIVSNYINDDNLWLQHIKKCVNYNWSRENVLFRNNIIKKLNNRLKLVNTNKAISEAISVVIKNI